VVGHLIIGTFFCNKVIIVIVFLVLSSWHSCCKSSPGSSDECSTAPGGCQPLDQADRLKLTLFGLSPFQKCIITTCLLFQFQFLLVVATSFSLLTTDRINLRTKRYRKCHKLEPVGIFYTGACYTLASALNSMVWWYIHKSLYCELSSECASERLLKIG